MHERELQQIGLTEKEAKVYLAALTLGKATANDISKKADLKRPTTYFTIDLLMEKGLVSSVHEGKKQFFMAESPDQLVNVYNKREYELRREGEKLKQIIPDLKKLSPKDEGGPVVKYYTGKDGALSMVRSLAKQADDKGVWILYPYDKVEKIFTDEERNSIKFHNNRPNTEVRAIYSSTRKILEDTEHMKRLKLPVSEEMPILADIAVYGDVLRLVDLEGGVTGVSIENARIAETIRTLFKMAWKVKDNQ
ncbi:hypothetical protein KC850_04080 [Candidatus Kaiserbacteria bacterium]|nr:hypothetical protein [Candidatus Kaiserbacteria bacterium]